MKARKRYGKQLMTAEGSLVAALQEPCCDRDDRASTDKEERLESAWWDKVAVNAIRVMVYDVDPMEDFT